MKRVLPNSLTPQVAELAGLKLGRKFVPYQRMAGAIIALTNENGDCEPKDLLSLGYSTEATKERWHMAHAMAAVELRLMEAHHENMKSSCGARS